MRNIARIVPLAAEDGNPTPASGTKVYVGDEELGGIYRIELIAETSNIWRAVIHTYATVDGEIVAEPLDREGNVVDVTSLCDDSKRFALACGLTK